MVIWDGNRVVRPFRLKIDEVACRLAGRKVHDKVEGMGLWPSSTTYVG